jgi:hypothetical protein
MVFFAEKAPILGFFASVNQKLQTRNQKPKAVARYVLYKPAASLMQFGQDPAAITTPSAVCHCACTPSERSFSCPPL